MRNSLDDTFAIPAGEIIKKRFARDISPTQHPRLSLLGNSMLE
jgi:hypothetical protein